MPYGLATSPSVFQGFMSKVFQEFPPLRYNLHRWHLNLLLEPGRALPPRYIGPSEAHREPPVLKTREMVSKWTRVRFSLSRTGHNHNESVNCNVSWVSSISTTVLWSISVRSVPLYHACRPCPKSLSWDSTVIEAFQNPKNAFCTTPTLAHMNPNLPRMLPPQG